MPVRHGFWCLISKHSWHTNYNVDNTGDDHDEFLEKASNLQDSLWSREDPPNTNSWLSPRLATRSATFCGITATSRPYLKNPRGPVGIFFSQSPETSSCWGNSNNFINKRSTWQSSLCPSHTHPALPGPRFQASFYHDAIVTKIEGLGWDSRYQKCNVVLVVTAILGGGG